MLRRREARNDVRGKEIKQREMNTGGATNGVREEQETGMREGEGERPAEKWE